MDEHKIVVTQDLLLKAYNDALKGMVVKEGKWRYPINASESFLGFITLEDGRKALVSVRVDSDLDRKEEEG